MLSPLRIGPSLRPPHLHPLGVFAPCRSFTARARPGHTASLLSLDTRPAVYLRSSPLLVPRFLSLGSIFNRPTVQPTPSPSTIAGIARLEAEANASPHDVDKQLALFAALAATKHKAGYESVITRWERMSEFVRAFVPLHSMSLTLLRTGFVIPAPPLRRWIPALPLGAR
jgi:ATP-dependent metalloprotease